MSSKKLPIIGADVSTLEQIEDYGGKFYHNGKESGLIEILKKNGFNFIRLKIWNNPGLPLSDPKGYNDKEHVLCMAERVKKFGFNLLIDFHYSDFWADPEKQIKPKKWNNYNFNELIHAVYEYTKEVITAFKNKNLIPDIIQIGNEIDNGFLWDDGKIDGTSLQWDKFCDLIKAGIAGIKDSLDNSFNVKIMIHKADGGNNKEARDFFDNIILRGINFDLIGFSFYPKWHGNFNYLKENLNDMALRYDKDIIVVETAWGWTMDNFNNYLNKVDYPKPLHLPFSVNGQEKFFIKLARVIKSVPKNKGKGFFYWEPGFIPVKGAGWKYREGNEWCNMTLFDFDGNALDSLKIFSKL